jgi:hypothetical protein
MALGQEWPSPFRHLPENTMAVAHVRVEALVKSDWGKTALAELAGKKDIKESVAKLKSGLGIDVAEVDSLTFLILDPIISGESNPRPMLSNGRWSVRPNLPTGPNLAPPPNLPPAAAPAQLVPAARAATTVSTRAGQSWGHNHVPGWRFQPSIRVDACLHRPE